MNKVFQNVRVSYSKIAITYYSITSTPRERVDRTVDRTAVERTVEYPLTEISVEELLQYRASGNPGFVLKSKEHLFYTSVPRDLKLLSQWNHCCNHCTNLYPSKCRKIWDLSLKKDSKDYKEGINNILTSKRIEKYNFITLGFETFNVQQESFVVLKCSKWENIPAYTQKLSPKERQALKLAIAKAVWPDVKDLNESKKKSERNMW